MGKKGTSTKVCGTFYILLQYNFFFLNRNYVFFARVWIIQLYFVAVKVLYLTVSQWQSYFYILFLTLSLSFYTRWQMKFYFFYVCCNFYTCKMKKYFIFHKLMNVQKDPMTFYFQQHEFANCISVFGILIWNSYGCMNRNEFSKGQILNWCCAQ